MWIALLLSLLPSAMPADMRQNPGPASEPFMQWDGETEDAYRRALHLWAVRGKPGEAADILLSLADKPEVTQIAGQASWVLVLAAQALAEAGRGNEASPLLAGIERGARGTELEKDVMAKLGELKGALGEGLGLDPDFSRHIFQLLSSSSGDHVRIAQYGSQAIPYLLNIILDSSQGYEGNALAALMQTITPADLPVVLSAIQARSPEEVQILLATNWPLPKSPEAITAVSALLIELSADPNERVAQEVARQISNWLWQPAHSRAITGRALELAQVGPASVVEAMLEHSPRGAFRGGWQEVLEEASRSPWPRVREQARWILATMPDGADRSIIWLSDDTLESKIRYCFSLGVGLQLWNQSQVIRDRLSIVVTSLSIPEAWVMMSQARVTEWAPHVQSLQALGLSEDPDVRLMATLAAWQNRSQASEALAVALQHCQKDAWFPDLLDHWKSNTQDREGMRSFDTLGEVIWTLVNAKSDVSADAATVLLKEYSRALRYGHADVIRGLGLNVQWPSRVSNWYQQPIDVASLKFVCLDGGIDASQRNDAASVLVRHEPKEFLDVLKKSEAMSAELQAQIVRHIPTLIQSWSPGNPNRATYSADELALCLERLESRKDGQLAWALECQSLAYLFGSNDLDAFEAFRRYASTPERARLLLQLNPIETNRTNSARLILHWLNQGWPATTWLRDEHRTLLDTWINPSDPQNLELARVLSTYKDLPFQRLLVSMFQSSVIALELRDITLSWLNDPRLAPFALDFHATLYRDASWPQKALDVLALPDLLNAERNQVVRLMAFRPDPAFLPLFLQWMQDGDFGEYPQQGLQRLKEVEDQKAYWESWQATGVGGSPTAALLKQIQSKNKEVRLSAIRALGALKAPEALPLLISLLEDPDPEVVAAARAGLTWLNPESAPK